MPNYLRSPALVEVEIGRNLYWYGQGSELLSKDDENYNLSFLINSIANWLSVGEPDKIERIYGLRPENLEKIDEIPGEKIEYWDSEFKVDGWMGTKTQTTVRLVIKQNITYIFGHPDE